MDAPYKQISTRLLCSQNITSLLTLSDYRFTQNGVNPKKKGLTSNSVPASSSNVLVFLPNFLNNQLKDPQCVIFCKLCLNTSGVLLFQKLYHSHQTEQLFYTPWKSAITFSAASLYGLSVTLVNCSLLHISSKTCCLSTFKCGTSASAPINTSNKTEKLRPKLKYIYIAMNEKPQKCTSVQCSSLYFQA